MTILSEIVTSTNNSPDQEVGNITYMMFSATFPKTARDLAKEHLAHDHVRIRVGRAGSSHKNIEQTVIFVEASAKRKALLDLLYSKPPARTIIFVNSKRSADEIDDYLFNMDLPVTSIHSDRTQMEREDSLRAFRTGKCPILVATGVSARGLDIRVSVCAQSLTKLLLTQGRMSCMSLITIFLALNSVVSRSTPIVLVSSIDFDTYSKIFPDIHISGRTGRAGNTGIATSFYNERDSDLAEVLTKTLMETGQNVPDFLEEHKPEEGASLKFEADSDCEDEEVGKSGSGAGGGNWGTPAQDAPVTAAAGGWGAPAAAASTAPADDGWGSTPATNSGAAW